ncbi:MAG: energy-coupled thiamine transporter ThiT [Clostridiales bacterium]|nr:energy-coupled thiamine transporter ThiT [Clostridiales bacterium]
MSQSVLIMVVFTVLYFAITIFLTRGVRLGAKEVCLCGLTIALTMILESIRIPLPTGSSLTFVAMLPRMLLAVICDPRMTFLSGWVCGILVMFLVPGWYLVHWGQFFVEHMVCFSCYGYTGILGSDKRWKILGGIIIASLLTVCGHTLSGVVFFSQNAWVGWGAWGYSIAYNFSEYIPECILAGIILMIMPLDVLKKAVGKERV